MEGIVADRTYQTGDLMHCEEPFAKILSTDSKKDRCEACFEKSTNLKLCKPCLAVKYCSKSCQRKDWSDHRLECKHLKNLPNCKQADFTRLLGKIILKIKGRDWKTITRTVLGREVSFDDIDPHLKEMTENPRKILYYKKHKELLKAYIGEDNMPEDDDLLKIMGKVQYNLIRRYEAQEEVGARFFIGYPFFQKECIPNSNIQIVQNKMKIWANRKIKKGKKKISIKFPWVLELSEKLDEECRCTDCSLPYGESILTKIIDDKKAYDVITETETVLMMSSVISDEHVLPVDHLLDKQIGVLGDTNVLHLKLLALKALQKSDPLLESLATVIALEKKMRAVFGEFSLEMEPIYFVLRYINTRLGNVGRSTLYAEKLRKFHAHDSVD